MNSSIQHNNHNHVSSTQHLKNKDNTIRINGNYNTDKFDNTIIKTEDCDDEIMTDIITNNTKESTGTTTNGDIVTQYLCVPVKSDGTVVPTEAFIQSSSLVTKQSNSNHSNKNNNNLSIRTNTTNTSTSMVDEDDEVSPCAISPSGIAGTFKSSSFFNDNDDYLDNVDGSTSNVACRTSSGTSQPSNYVDEYLSSSSLHGLQISTKGDELSSYNNPITLPTTMDATITNRGPSPMNIPINLPTGFITSSSAGPPRLFTTTDGTQIAFLGNNRWEVIANNGYSPEQDQRQKRKWQRWTDEEDEILRYAVNEEGGDYGTKWKRISKKYFSGIRSDFQCKNRWKFNLQPGLVRGRWTAKEDEIIKSNRLDKNMTFSNIAKLLPGRITEQVKERWLNTLDPTIKRTPWTDDEIKILFDAQAELGNQWVKIAKLLPGRSENNVKNQWYNAIMAQRRKMKKIAKQAEHTNRLKRARGEEV